MTASGVVAADEVATTFTELQRGKKYRYFICKVSDDKKSIVVDEKGDRNETFAQFVAKLPEKECRYAVFDYEWTVGSQGYDRICFIAWAPDAAPIKEKMLASSSKDAVVKKFGGEVHKKFQASDKGDLDEDDFRQKCEGK